MEIIQIFNTTPQVGAKMSCISAYLKFDGKVRFSFGSTLLDG